MIMSLDIFEQLKNNVSNIDPIFFVEKNLMLEGEPFKLNGNGYKPFVEIYRKIVLSASNEDSKPFILVKGRQIGGTVMAAALEAYFMASGLYGCNGKPPIRIIHAFPNLIHVFTYAKTKLNPIIRGARPYDKPIRGKKVSILEAKLDKSSESSDSLQYKQFEGGNFLRIESTGLDADRLRGGTVDAIFYDECFPYDQLIETIDGKIKIGEIYDKYINNESIPLVKSYNENLNIFEYKNVTKAWDRGKKSLVSVHCDGISFSCTKDHKFLTDSGWRPVSSINHNGVIKNSNNEYSDVLSIIKLNKEERVYDIEVEDNHNFVICNEEIGLIAHNCQDTPKVAIQNANKLLTKAKYGSRRGGIQVYFGTPKQRGSFYYELWTKSSQQFYYLGCEKCEKHFPLYTPGSSDWEKIWLYGYIVKCVHCGHTQDKRDAAERGKWVGTRPEDECELVGYHINQMYNPRITREDMEYEKPENHPINTERAWQNEVLGEFFAGEMGPLTAEQIEEKCADIGRQMSSGITLDKGKKVYVGFDWGKRSDADAVGAAEAKKAGGQSYSTCVVLVENGHQLSIEYATIIKKNDFEYKKNFVDEIMRKYSVTQAVGDIGYAGDLSEVLHHKYGDRFVTSNLLSKVNGYAKFNDQQDPKVILVEREHYLEELFSVMKKGLIRFPWGDWEKISWLIQHCTSMEVKTTLNAVHEPVRRYVKGNGPNDGLMALLNAYIAYKFVSTNGFNQANPLLYKEKKKGPMVVTGYCPR
jgi:hypothetical protein